MSYHLETLAIHAGQENPDPATNARAVPVYRTTAYNFRNSQHGADLFGLRELGNIYGRLMNPTNDVLEKRLAALDGGAAALTLSSGTAAVYFTITNIAQAGDEIVAANNLYGGTFTQFDAILPQGGITVRFADVNNFAAVEAAINDKTRAIFIETVGNPLLGVADIEGYAKVAQKYHLPLIVDATFTPPSLLRPLEHGANLVIHSLSKWLGGHGAGIGGAVIEDGKFDWTDPKFALFNEPNRGYHGLRFAHDLGALNPVAFSLRLRTVGLRNQGPTLAPDAAWIFLQGVETLALRMAKHSENALKVAQFLQGHKKVEWARYPGFDALAKKYLPNGAGGMVVFGVRGGSAEAQKLVDNVKLFSLLANVGDAKSLIIHPASTTHSQLSDEDQRKGGLHPELIRLSIGLEHLDDIIGALAEALDTI
ncbi:MAG: aminotransferase class I/II-fold pyridoxal phosphate-dependent enzyme [Planctomycetota bacterium]|jgi:O-acetylhomoserine (thiol)-lyase|nr:aminotransferase class I/II-fold pyridoxal phosphate-dependent enzyme [Planctomycetota bacterium]